MRIRLYYQNKIIESIICIIIVFPFCYPISFEPITGIDMSYLILADAIIMLAAFFIFLHRLIQVYLVIGAFFLQILFSTFVNNGEIFAAFLLAGKVLCFVIIINLYAKMNKLDVLLSSIKLLLSLYIFINLIFQFYQQDYFGFTEGGNFLNFLTSDNDLGYWYIPFILIVYLVDVKRSRRYQLMDFIIWTAVCFASLVKAWSANCMVIFAVFIFMICLKEIPFLKNFFNYLSPIFSIVLNIGLSIAVIIFQIQYLFRGFIENILHKSITLTDRVIVWTHAIQNILNKPIIGYGTTANGRMRINWNPVYHVWNFSHNMFLEILIQGGIIAFAIYIYIYLSATLELKKYSKSDLMLYINISIFSLLMMQFAECALYEPLANFPLILCFFYKDLMKQGYVKKNL